MDMKSERFTRNSDWQLKGDDIRRIHTRICGLDRLLYGGFDTRNIPFTIVIRGGIGTEKTLMGLQIMYGIALSLNEKEYAFGSPDGKLVRSIYPCYISACHDKTYVRNLLCDTFVSSCLFSLTKKILENTYEGKDYKSITELVFDTKEIKCAMMQPFLKLPIEKIKSMPDKLIAENVLYYNSRTKSLHYRTVDCVADESNLVYKLSQDFESRMLNVQEKMGNGSEIKGKKEKSNETEHKKADKILCELLNTKMLETLFVPTEELDGMGNVPLLCREIDNTKAYTFEQMRDIIQLMKKKAGISILIVDKGTKVPANDADILIDLYNKVQRGYVLHYLNVTHNSHQDSVMGEHQYKKRDYGIEVFPSVHTYFKKKKNFHRSYLYTHSSFIEDTFPQYLSREAQLGRKDLSYDDFDENRCSHTKMMMDALHPFNNIKLLSYDILKKIFLSPRNNEQSNTGNMYENEKGLVTAVIGGGNRFKRYLTIGSAFSSAAQNEDTLIVILNKEKHLIQKRMSCPARMPHNCYKMHCEDCYKHFHFMSIYSEYITRDEFLYMFEQRIKLAYDKMKNRFVKRIIIDDLQILDYSFPLLKGDSDFLNAIMIICRERGISLYILCDKDAKSRDVLKSIADNIVYMEKTSDGRPIVYVERCSGYYNPPSRLYCGEIKKIERLFECNERYDRGDVNNLYFTINPVYIIDKSVAKIDDLWKS